MLYKKIDNFNMESKQNTQRSIQKRQIQEIKKLSEKVVEQKELLVKLENDVDELTEKICKIKEETKFTVYSPHILIILCIIFLVAQSCKASY